MSYKPDEIAALMAMMRANGCVTLRFDGIEIVLGDGLPVKIEPRIPSDFTEAGADKSKAANAKLGIVALENVSPEAAALWSAGLEPDESAGAPEVADEEKK